MNCETCQDTHFYGDNGPGIRGNSEWQPCDQCSPPGPKTTPEPLYSCVLEHCAEEQSWPAHDLFWHPGRGGWICINCKSDSEEEISDWTLKKELAIRPRQRTELLKECLTELKHCRTFIVSRERMAPVGIEQHEALIRNLEKATQNGTDC